MQCRVLVSISPTCLRKAFTHAEFPQKNWWLECFFALLKSACIKALSKTLMKLTFGHAIRFECETVCFLALLLKIQITEKRSKKLKFCMTPFKDGPTKKLIHTCVQNRIKNCVHHWQAIIVSGIFMFI